MPKRERWYCSDSFRPTKPAAVVQIDSRFDTRYLERNNEKPMIPAAIHARAAEEYNRQGFGQSNERMQERGGLSLIEIMCLLMDAIERLEKADAES